MVERIPVGPAYAPDVHLGKLTEAVDACGFRSWRGVGYGLEEGPRPPRILNEAHQVRDDLMKEAPLVFSPSTGRGQ